MFDRLRINFITKWWASIDKVTLFLCFLLIVFGNIFVALASPVVASRIGIAANTFVIKNLVFSIFGAIIIITFSTLNSDKIIKISFIGFFALIFLMVLVLLIGDTKKINQLYKSGIGNKTGQGFGMIDIV